MEDRSELNLTFIRPDTSTQQELSVAGGSVQAGFPSPADDFLDAPLDLNKALIHNPASTFIVRVSGDSMNGDGIGNGDLLIVDKSIEAYDGCIAICYLNGEFTVKRVKIEHNNVSLLPSNPKYPPIKVTANSELVIWGCRAPCHQNFQVTKRCTDSATATIFSSRASGSSDPT